ncbi:WhiB family transcriptional regulator [Streptomyces qinzhouensis]|uniref:Transcriptional regulator WhiB n=1 Tax=Streptomyces qinzhouensis TaxID=2599401 RepID=A0A5B8JA20_9ACTN|nr:WhiB family transcriptional regulator [Streptomyces qinzhouensis]QDY78166.1 WhiB family transcriptional regulator [Streptomyces qinzhouensis]
MHSATTHEPRTLGDHTWQNQAACHTTPHADPELFFPEPDEIDRIRAAKTICAQCPVRRTCLDAALENGDRDGIRGGLTEEERDALHSKLAQRLDYTRINATLAGGDVHLSRAERRAVARDAYRAGIPADQLARRLKVTVEHAKKLYRHAAREISHRNTKTKPKATRTAKAAPITPARTPVRTDLGTAA